jgi:hypothetical protein
LTVVPTVVRRLLAGHALRVDRRAREQLGRRYDVREHRERSDVPRTQRDALASQIRAALWDDEFNGKAKAWIAQGQDNLAQASSRCASFPSS